MTKAYRSSQRWLIYISFLFAIVAMPLTNSCSKNSDSVDTTTPIKPDDNNNSNQFRITGLVLSSRIDISKGGDYTFNAKGFTLGDEIVFEAISNPALGKLTFSGKEITADKFTFTFPTDFTQGNYRVYAKRGIQTISLGNTSVNIFFNANLPDKTGMTVKGTVHANGVGLADVVVSDGFEVTKTDASGIYYLASQKKAKYVFLSIPSNYEVEHNRNAPQFFQRLQQPTHIVETKDFELTPVNNENHVIMMLGDMQLSNRNNDIGQFQSGFLPDVNASIDRYKNQGKKVYGITLGDMTWETYWLSNRFGLSQYMLEMTKVNMPIFNAMGNHDNDPSFINDDWGSENTYREIVGPTYYSFNIGQVHYIVLDDIQYVNTNGTRNYNGVIVPDQLEWFKKDLATITDKSKPVIIIMHIQLNSNPSLNASGDEKSSYRLTGSESFVNALNGFTNVNIISGHTHINYNVERSTRPGLMEHNTGAICATWWWTGAPGYAGNQICKDGTPAGYGIWEAENSTVKWTYKTIGENENYQFRAYDLNQVHLTREKYAPSYTGSDWNTYAGEYASANNRNEVLINVWNYDKAWKVEVQEDGAPLAVTRVRALDPLHIISYSAQRLNRNAVPTSDFVSTLTAHLFKVKAKSATSTLEIKVTDRFGRLYTETMIRPKSFGYTMK